ncbi:hypothetical protein DFR33_108116 [Bradymonas sediminis]|nr:hypothetical protein DFR33_108116 [Bradymonas sediminis]
MRRVILCFVCAAALVGFSSGCGDDEGSKAAPVSLESMPQAYSSAVCERIFSCCSAQEITEELNDAAFSTEEECLNTFGAQLEKSLQGVQDAVAQGRSSYDSNRAGECISDMRAAACSEGLWPGVNPAPPSCDLVFVGLVDMGGDCATTEECREGQCVGAERDETTGMASKMGVCSPLGGLDDPCDWKDDCQDGYFCSYRYDPVTQESASSCQVIAEVGEECLQFGCVDGAYCDVDAFDSSASETCKAYKTMGDTCAPGRGQCDPQTSYCPNSSSGDSECTALKSIDEACESGLECESNRCESADSDSSGNLVCVPYAPQVCMGA